MARQDSNHPIVGRIGDLIYYKRDGKYFVRKAGGPSKEKIKTAPEFEKTRKINSEFSGIVKAGRDLRMALAPLIPDHSDPDISGRLVGLFSKVIKNGKGEPGSRMIEVVKSREIMRNFQFHKKISFDRLFSKAMHFSSSRKRKRVTVSVEDFDSSLYLAKVSSATHFRLFITLVAFSDFEFDTRENVYKPMNDSVHGNCSLSFSEHFLLGDVCNGFSISAQLPIKKSLTDSAGIIAIIGIEFCRENNGMISLIQGWSCMKVGDVF